MIQLKINDIDIQVPEGTTVLEAARQAGIHIPSMCYKGGHENHPSCMVCMVKDKKTGNLTTSCALEASNNMDISTDDPMVTDARKEALDLLMSDHVGDCEAPCSLACPANMNIPQMNRLIAANKFEESLQVVKEDIALPYVLGYICPAPCEKACRRKQVDDAVSVCLLKRFVAAEDSRNTTSVHKKSAKGMPEVAILGCGPAGLAAAYYLARYGYSCVVFDKNEKPGGTLRYSIPDEELPKEVIDSEFEIIRNLGVEFRFNVPVTKEMFESEIRPNFRAIVVATGDISVSNPLAEVLQFSKNGIVAEDGTFQTSEPGIFACGSIIRSQKMAVRAVAQGKAAAESVNLYLQGKALEKPVRRFNSRFDKLMPAEYPEYLKEAVADNRNAPKSGYLKGFTTEEAVLEAKRCMHCDCRKLDTCKLRLYSDLYKVDRKKYLIGERKLMTKYIHHNEVIYEPEKCIRCGLCVDITLKSKEIVGLTYVGRGFDVRIDAALGNTMNEALTHTAQLCVESCPTGALAMK